MRRSLFLAVLVLVLSAGSASATTLGFECVKDSDKCAAGESQLTVELPEADSELSPLGGVGPGEISFILRNEGEEDVIASQIFFDDNAGVLGDLLDVTDGTGVDFAEGGKPDNLKGGKKINFFADFFASASKPTKENGVNPGEEITINFMLTDGTTLEDVLAAIDSGDLVIGVNAKKAYITTNAVPEPGLLMLLALGAAALGVTRRR